jgi:hypothetical protein
MKNEKIKRMCFIITYLMINIMLMSKKNPKQKFEDLLLTLFISLVLLSFIWLTHLRSVLIPSAIAVLLIFSFSKVRKYNENEYWKDIGLIAAILITGVGWFVNGYLQNERDVANKARELKTKYLLNAYYRIENSFNRGSIDSMPPEGFIYRKFEESAIAQIALLSDLETIKKSNDWAKMVNSNKLNLDSNRVFLEALRKEIRDELGLERVPQYDADYQLSSLRINNDYKIRGLSSDQIFEIIMKANEINDFK